MAQRRATVGHSQESLAAKLVVDVRSVRRWESGDSAPVPHLRPRLANALRWTPEELERALTSAEPAESLDDSGSGYDSVDESSQLTPRYFDHSAHRATSLAADVLLGSGNAEDLNQQLSGLAKDYLDLPLTKIVPKAQDALDQARTLLRFTPDGPRRSDTLLAAARSLALLANAAMDTGAHSAAHQHADAAAALAAVAGHSPTVAWLRGLQASNAHWSGNDGHSAELAASAQELSRDGAAELYIAGLRARAAGRLGDLAHMREAIDVGRRVADLPANELMVGVFGFSEAKQNLYIASGLLGAREDAQRALSHAQLAVALYTDTTVAQAHGFGDLAGARIDVATANIRLGDYDGAEAALSPVLALPQNQRVATIQARLERLVSEIELHRTRRADDLAERVRAEVPRTFG